MLRFQSGYYVIHNVFTSNSSPFYGVVSADLKEDVKRWVTWRVEFKSSMSSQGFMRIWRDGVYLGDVNGPSTTADTLSYVKLGVYLQGACAPTYFREYVKNFTVVETSSMTGTLPPLSTVPNAVPIKGRPNTSASLVPTLALFPLVVVLLFSYFPM
jgi:hypothetical protein